MSKIKTELVTDLKDVNNQLIKITIEDSPYYFCKKEVLLTTKEAEYLIKEITNIAGRVSNKGVTK